MSGANGNVMSGANEIGGQLADRLRRRRQAEQQSPSKGEGDEVERDAEDREE